MKPVFDAVGVHDCTWDYRDTHGALDGEKLKKARNSQIPMTGYPTAT